jgi:hypothetical protein
MWYKLFCQPKISVRDHDLHSGNITCGGHRMYKCMSIDTDYQSNRVTVTMFISTYLFRHASFICPKPKSAVYSNEMFITTTCSLASSISCTSTGSYEAPHIASLKPSLGWLPDHMPHHNTDVPQFCGVARSANHGFVVGIRQTWATIP